MKSYEGSMIGPLIGIEYAFYLPKARILVEPFVGMALPWLFSRGIKHNSLISLSHGLDSALDMSFKANQNKLLFLGS